MNLYYYSKPNQISKREFYSVEEYQRDLSKWYENVNQQNVLILIDHIKWEISDLSKFLANNGKYNPIFIGVSPARNSEGQTHPLFAFKTDEANFLFSKHREFVENYHNVAFISEQVDLHI